MQTKSLSERIADIEKLDALLLIMEKEANTDSKKATYDLAKASRVLHQETIELMTGNQALLAKNGELEAQLEKYKNSFQDSLIKTNQDLITEKNELEQKNQALEDELETRRAFIVANPCEQCGGKINAMKCEAWQNRAEELESQIEEEKLKTLVHQADANCGKRDHESDKVFYRKCLKTLRDDRDRYKHLWEKDSAQAKEIIRELEAKVKEFEGKIEWQPLETAPLDGTPVLLLHKDYCDRLLINTAFWETRSNGEWAWHSNGCCDFYQTFSNPKKWMPLPKLPTQTKESDAE